MARKPNQSTIERTTLCLRGEIAVTKFCHKNGIAFPGVHPVDKDKWWVNSCAYYRPQEGIRICPQLCQTPCGAASSRNWSWPGNTVDRTPYGVVCHELGHHVDWISSDTKGKYYGSYSVSFRKESGEAKLTNYCPNDAEWFAEMFRLFMTNPGLLKQLRPRTYNLLRSRWKPVRCLNWRICLGPDVPDRVVNACINKGAK